MRRPAVASFDLTFFLRSFGEDSSGELGMISSCLNSARSPWSMRNWSRDLWQLVISMLQQKPEQCSQNISIDKVAIAYSRILWLKYEGNSVTYLPFRHHLARDTLFGIRMALIRKRQVMQNQEDPQGWITAQCISCWECISIWQVSRSLMHAKTVVLVSVGFYQYDWTVSSCTQLLFFSIWSKPPWPECSKNRSGNLAVVKPRTVTMQRCLWEAKTYRVRVANYRGRISWRLSSTSQSYTNKPQHP